MSQALSNLSLCLPLSSGAKIHNFLKPQSFFKPVNNGSLGHKRNGVIAMAMPGETRDNLDRLQRPPKQPPPPPPLKKRTAPTPPIGLWDRFPTARTVQQMMETMERMMEDPLEYAGESSLPRGTGPYGRGRTPWEIKEREKEYKMRFDMPGMTKEDVKVWIEEKMLVLKAEKEEQEEEWSAKSYGKYGCRIALPENVQFEKIKAEVKDGVLYITIPKADTTSKILDINVE